ncbi:Proteasome subunit beta type-4 [Ascosphaera atra]|nr:Proteasome subunit beta type-4 [Ascosphaera atra]
MRNEAELSPAAIANFVRGEIAHHLRSRSPYTVNLLLGGVNPITGKPSLYWIDYLASLAELPYAAHDKHHHPDIDLEQGLKLLGMCTDELKRRLPIDYKGVYVKVITKDGVRDLDWEENKDVPVA